MRTIGVEEHAWPPALRDALLKYGQDATVDMTVRNKALDEQLCDVGDLRLERMAEAGVDFQILSVPPPGVQPLPGAEAVALAREVNDFLGDAVAAHPKRFAAMATLPTQDPNAAAAELDRCVRELGMVGVMAYPRTGDRYLDHEDFRPVFEAAAELAVPIYVHPQLPPQAVMDASYSGFSPMLNTALASVGWGWHMESGIAALRLILAGTFDRHPELQLILGHWGEFLVSFLDRADILSMMAGHLHRRVAEYVTQNVVATAGGVFSQRMLLDTIAALGGDRVLFAQDYPFVQAPGGKARAFVEAATISPDDRVKLGHLNAERIFGISAKAAPR